MIKGVKVPASCIKPINYEIGVLFQKGRALIVNEARKGAAASEAGIKQGDRILAVNGIKVSMNESLKSIVTAAGPQELTLTVRRDKKEIRVKVTPKEKPVVYRDVILDLEILPLNNTGDEVYLEIVPVPVKGK